MMRMFDVKSDLELLSQLFDGTRYKAAPDRGLTLAPNLDSYASRAVQIAKELGSLAKMGRYVVRPLYYMEDAKDTGVWPTFFIPQTSISVGGVDQPYKPLKKRRVADASGAHVEVLARNRDDGAPDGEPYVSLNERYGPMRPAAGQQVCEVPHRLTPFGSLCDCCHVVLVRHSADGAHMWWGMLFCWRCLEGKLWRALEPLKWHKEGKHRVHHIYRACAYLGAAADIVQEDLTVLEDDWKTQFWQFRVHPIELPTSTMYAWVELYSSQIAWCHVAAYVNDMGKSPSSNISSSTSIHHVEVWKRNMVAIAAPVIATMGEEMNDMLDTRRERFGEMQALLWAAFAFTDDIILILVSAVLGALGAQEWDRISEVMKIQMSESDKRGCGTCPVHIGIRFVVNGGFGCAPPQKRVRALSGLRHAIDGTLHHATPIRAKAFESNCGLVGYLVDALAIDRALLRGIKRPLELAVFLDSEVTLTWDGLANHLELEFLISARGAASFDTAVRDALLLAGKSTATQRIAARRIRMGSDACTDAAHPAIYGMAECLAYVFPLTGAWLRLHVTVTESAGACLDFLVFPRRFPLALFCNETDASAAHAMVLGRSKSPTLKKMYSLLRKDPYFQAAAQRSTSQQVSGIANMTRDAGSRGHVEALRTYAAAMKMNIVVVELSEHELGFMAAILEATLEIGEALLVHPEPGTAMDVSDEAPLWQQLEPRAAGATSMAVVPDVEYGGEAQEVIKFMLHAASPPSRLQPKPCTRVEGHRWLADCRYDPPRCGAVHCCQMACEVSVPCGCRYEQLEPRTAGATSMGVVPGVGYGGEDQEVIKFMLRAASPSRRLQPRPCTSAEGHRWLVNCRYEPPRCGAVWCGQVACEVTVPCDCADPQESPMLRTASPERRAQDAALGETPIGGSEGGAGRLQVSPRAHSHCSMGAGRCAREHTSRGSPGLAQVGFLSPGDDRAAVSPASPVPCAGELRAARLSSPRVLVQSAPVASPVDIRQPATVSAGHMRPNTAAALRQLGTSKLVAKLALDESEWALLPHSTERLAAIVQSVAAAKLAAIPVNTASADDNGVRWLGLVCEDLDTTPLRPGPEHAFEEREALLGAHFLCFHSEHAKVNVHFAVTPSGAQRTRVKPSSSFSAYLAARRALEDYGSYVPPMKTVLKVLKGLDKQMLLEFGEDALAKIQALPWSTAHLDAFQSTLTSGDKLQWHRSKCDMCHCMLAFALGVACRKEESPRYRRSNVAWFTGKLVQVPLDREGVASLCNAYFCRMRPVSSKTDQSNVEWGNHYMWFRVDTSAWWSLGAALMWIEQTYFVEPQHRLSTPLFFNPGGYGLRAVLVACDGIYAE